jgi:arsenate reductase
MTVTLYGIPNCDTVKKARAWLDANDVVYAFHDYKKLGADPAKLAEWANIVSWEPLLNRGGTTFRKLDEADRVGLDRDKAIALMAAHPSLIKRPVVERDGALMVGFTADCFAEAFG